MELLPAAATLDQRARRPVGGALAAVGSSRAEGKWAASRVPRPEALWRLTRPPCSSTSERPRGSPSPVPSTLRFTSLLPFTTVSSPLFLSARPFPLPFFSPPHPFPSPFPFSS